MPLPLHPGIPAPLPPREWAPLDGEVTALVRPYLVAHEQQERRGAPALALDGVDVGPRVIHGVHVGAAA